MKIFSKFKKFSRDIKLIIITALLVSCVGVYAAGECIISATAGDVTYNGTTVQAAIDELYDMASTHCPEGYECTENQYSIGCGNNKLHTTIPDNLNGLAKIMAESAYRDDGQSDYVTSCTGVDFSAISSDTNGKGIYEIASTKNDPYPIYYYRGAVDNNNVKFGGFCWKAIRTTDTGGVKMIYNGEPDGSGNCTNTTGTDTQIGTSTFNTTYTSLAYAGYMYGTVNIFRDKISLTTSNQYGNDVTYSDGKYTLINTISTSSIWSNSYNTLNNNHYTCFSTGKTCSTVNYVYYTTTSRAYYIELTNGNKIEDALNDLFSNTTSSIAKSTIDTWYNTNLSSYTNYIEDTVYCNDRSISYMAGWDPNGGDTTQSLIFASYTRTYTNYTPSLICTRESDRFTVSNSIGNGDLTYPVGLLTSDEVMYAGGRKSTDNTNYYLYSNQNYWIGSVYSIIHNNEIGEFAVYNTGTFLGSSVSNTTGVGLRPVISLKSTDVVVSGDGTSTNPYVIETS